jgi:hypothetical protein
MQRCLLIAISLLVMGCGATPRCATVDAQGIADAVHPNTQFKHMLEGVVRSTVTAKIIMRRDGVAGSQTLSKAIEAAAGRHQAEWDRNVVASWNTLAADELGQVCTALAGRDEATYMRFATRAGAEAKNRNEPVLKRAATEVLAAVF